MFTQNYINFTKARFICNGTMELQTPNGDAVNFNTVLSDYNDIGYCMNYARCYQMTVPYESTTSSVNYNPGVWFGRGASPASLADYMLEDPITSGLSIVNGSATVIYVEDGKYVASATYTVTNNTDEEVTIKEMGVFCQQIRKASSSKFYIYNVLMERTVLDTPVVIAPGAAKVITYKITFSQSQ